MVVLIVVLLVAVPGGAERVMQPFARVDEGRSERP
jgi:hypothetical protein